jgi:hypothetical protein
VKFLSRVSKQRASAVVAALDLKLASLQILEH